VGRGTAENLARPNGARVYDYLLGGTAAYGADRHLAGELTDPVKGYPGMRALARENRNFVTRAVTWSASRGIRRYLDLGCGLWGAGPSVHQTARAVHDDALVCYVDVDDVVACHLGPVVKRAGEGVTALQADIRDTEKVLSSPEAKAILGAREPVCVLLTSVLPFMSVDEGRRIVEQYMDAVAPESCAVISCVCYEDEALGAKMSEMFSAAGSWKNHSREDVASFFTAARLRVIRGQVTEIRCWPFLPSGKRRSAAVIGGVGLKN